MGVVLVYDGGFEGLLCAFSRSLEEGQVPEDILPVGACAQGSLFADQVVVEADPERAMRMCSRICERVSQRVLRRCLYAFLSEEEGREVRILEYLRLGFEVGAEVDSHLHRDFVRAVRDMARRTAHEAHRMRGFLRFRLLDGGMYYAPMEARCDVLRMVAPHFARRLEGQDWIIHDLVRGWAALCHGGKPSFVEVPEFAVDLCEREGRVQGLWRDYFKAIAVAERRNPRLQKNLMPERYWRMLVEIPQEH